MMLLDSLSWLALVDNPVYCVKEAIRDDLYSTACGHE
jgi:hypothetical protein